jgi:hypothetical protein
VEARFFARPVGDDGETMSPRSEMLEESQPEVVNLIDSQADLIEADLVRTSRSYVGSLNAEEVELHQAAAMDVKAHTLNANSSVMGLSHATINNTRNSIVLAARSDHMDLGNSLTGAIYAENVTLAEGSQTGILVTGNATGEKIRTVVLVARQVNGPVETMLNTRQVVLASVLTGVTSGILLLLGQILFRRKKIVSPPAFAGNQTKERR